MSSVSRPKKPAASSPAASPAAPSPAEVQKTKEEKAKYTAAKMAFTQTLSERAMKLSLMTNEWFMTNFFASITAVGKSSPTTGSIPGVEVLDSLKSIDEFRSLLGRHGVDMPEVKLSS